MHVEFPGTAVEFGRIEAGTLFAFQLRDQTYIGIKTDDQRPGAGTRDCAVLWPGHPDLGDRPAVIAANAIGGPSVVAFQNVQLRPSLEPVNIRPGYLARVAAGDLVRSGDRWFLALAVSHNLADGVEYVDVESGRVSSGLSGTVHAIFPSWTVVARRGDEFEVICGRKGDGTIATWATLNDA